MCLGPVWVVCMLYSGGVFLVHDWMSRREYQAASMSPTLNLTSLLWSLALQYLPPSPRKDASDCLSSCLGSIPEYKLLLQVHYRNSKEKRELMKFLKFWVPYSFSLPEPVKIIRAKATTCESVSVDWEEKRGMWCLSRVELRLSCGIHHPHNSYGWKECCLVAKLCPTLRDPMDVACQDPLSMAFSRQEYWSGLPFPSPGESSNPGTELASPAWQDSLPPSHLGSPTNNHHSGVRRN